MLLLTKVGAHAMEDEEEDIGEVDEEGALLIISSTFGSKTTKTILISLHHINNEQPTNSETTQTTAYALAND